MVLLSFGSTLVLLVGVLAEVTLRIVKLQVSVEPDPRHLGDPRSSEPTRVDAAVDTPPVERLCDRGYATLILRLLVDRRCREVVYGDVGGLAEEKDGERWIHFHGSAALLDAVHKWLISMTDDEF